MPAQLTFLDLTNRASAHNHKLLSIYYNVPPSEQNKHNKMLKLECLTCGNVFDIKSTYYLKSVNGCEPCKKNGVIFSNITRKQRALANPKPKAVRFKLSGYEPAVVNMAAQKNVTLDPFIKGKAKNVRYVCNIHKKHWETYKKNFLDPTIKVKCCEYASRCSNFGPILEALAKKRNHSILTPFPTSTKQHCGVHCNIHNQTSNPIVEVYLKVKYGTPCCGKVGSAKSRIIHGLTVGRKNPDWRVNAEMNRWRKRVKSNPNQFLCKPSEFVETHHLWDAKNFPLIRYNPANGFVLGGSLHGAFHFFAGIKKPTNGPLLVEFLKDLKNLILLLEKNTPLSLLPKIKSTNLLLPFTNTYSVDQIDRAIHQLGLQIQSLGPISPPTP